MENQRIVMNVSAKGAQVKIEAFGYQGPACEKALEPLRQCLGVTSTVETKPEYYATDVNQAFAEG